MSQPVPVNLSMFTFEDILREIDSRFSGVLLVSVARNGSANVHVQGNIINSLVMIQGALQAIVQMAQKEHDSGGLILP